jgi:hypothetical protein
MENFEGERKLEPEKFGKPWYIPISHRYNACCMPCPYLYLQSLVATDAH